MSHKRRWVNYELLFHAGVQSNDRGIAAIHMARWQVTIRHGKVGRRLRRIVKRAIRRESRTTP